MCITDKDVGIQLQETRSYTKKCSGGYFANINILALH